jgi:hypothetical protein
LTGLLLLGPHLTEDNLHRVLAAAKHRTKKEVERLVRELNPLPDVPARIEALGPASVTQAHVAHLAPSAREMARSLCPVENFFRDRGRETGWNRSIQSSNHDPSRSDAT